MVSFQLPSIDIPWPTHMDYAGQGKAEKIFQIIIMVFAGVGFLWGYMCQQFSQTMYILAAGFILSCLLTLPPWPMYRQKPLKWQAAREIIIDEKTGETLLVAPGVAKGTPIKAASLAAAPSSSSSKGKKKK